MEQCPKCGRYMTFGMSYSAGNPVIFYTCSCGYDTRSQTTIATTSTNYVPSEWLGEVNTYEQFGMVSK